MRSGILQNLVSTLEVVSRVLTVATAIINAVLPPLRTLLPSG